MPAVEHHDPDLPLFEALRRGDSGALSEIMERHERWVRGVVYGVLGRVNELEDVMQNVWFTVWRRAESLEDTAKWRSWLYVIARNAAVDAGRKRTRQRALWKRVTALESRSARGESAPVENIVAQERHKKVLAAISSLPDIYRVPFVLRHLQDWSYRQIGETMDLPVNTVETRLVRARRLLRQALGDKVMG